MNKFRVYSLLAGLLDASTGWGLMLFPETVQSLMLVQDPLPDPSSRVVGAFVAGVGSLYVWAALRPGAGEGRLWNMFAMTALLRAYVGFTFAALVLTGNLGAMWLTVAVTDLVFGFLQAVWWNRWRSLKL